MNLLALFCIGFTGGVVAGTVVVLVAVRPRRTKVVRSAPVFTSENAVTLRDAIAGMERERGWRGGIIEHDLPPAPQPTTQFGPDGIAGGAR